MSLSELYDECYDQQRQLMVAQGKEIPFNIVLKERALAEFIRRVSTMQGKTTKPEHMKQDTPPEQAVAIIAGIEGMVSNLADGITEPSRAAESIQRGLEDLKILCGAKRGQPDGWLRKVW